MKMLKKLLAVVLTGAMALTLFTACGSKAVRDKDIADALNDIVKSSVAAGKHENYTFKPRADEQAMAKAIAALPESDRNIKGGELSPKVKEILGINENGANKNNFVWQKARRYPLHRHCTWYSDHSRKADNGAHHRSHRRG